MRPVVNRITERRRDRFGKREKLFPIAGITGAEFLRDTIGTHGAPFVMVTGEPDFVEIPESFVTGNLLRRQMTVIIVNRFLRGVVVVQLPRNVTVKEKIFGDEGFHHSPITEQAQMFGEMFLQKFRVQVGMFV